MAVKATGRADQQRYFRQLPAQIVKVLRGAGRIGGKVIAEEAKLRSRSDVVRDNVTVEVKVTSDTINVRITVKSGWARSVGTWLEYGTDPHFISVDDRQRGGMSIGRLNKQVRRGSLVINGERVGTTVFHTGAQPYPFFRPALDTKRTEAIAAAQAYINARLARGGSINSDEGDEA